MNGHIYVQVNHDYFTYDYKHSGSGTPFRILYDLLWRLIRRKCGFAWTPASFPNSQIIYVKLFSPKKTKIAGLYVRNTAFDRQFNELYNKNR